MVFLRDIRVTHVVAIVAVLCLFSRVGNIVTVFAGAAQAEEKSDAAEAEHKPEEAKAETAATPAAADVAGSDVPEAEAVVVPVPAPPMRAGQPVEWKDPGDSDFEYSDVDEKLYKDLIARREAVEKREKELAVRQALLEAGERELDQKISEMNSLKSQIEELLQQQSAEEKARTASLVKIYEGMKAKDAAKIFNEMEDGVLLEILSNMSERKSAPIIAVMDPERARLVTLMLAEQKKMPEDAGDLILNGNTQ